MSQSRPGPEDVTKVSALALTFTLIRKGGEVQHALVLDFQRVFSESAAQTAKVQRVCSESAAHGHLTSATLLRSSAIWRRLYTSEEGVSRRKGTGNGSEFSIGCALPVFFPCFTHLLPVFYPCSTRVHML